MIKPIVKIQQPPALHWVGDGFPVRTLFSYRDDVAQLSPFLLLDYAAPSYFEAAVTPRGVGGHPHRGFETVTIAYRGEVSHRDSMGHADTIFPGDVQWMTAGSGILHEEFHSQAFSERGGEFQMVQLWVNLPKADKLTTPKYQAIKAANIPVVPLPDDAGSLRLIAGDWVDTQGAASTFSPLLLWGVHLNAGADVMLPIPESWGGAVVVLEGAATINDQAELGEAHSVIFGTAGDHLQLQTQQAAAKVLVLAGAPLNEPIAGHGPFVMNTRAELTEAFNALQRGEFGVL